MKKFWKNANVRLKMGIIITAIFFIIGFVVYFIPHQDPFLYNTYPPKLGMSAEHWLGTTGMGQDIVWQLVEAIHNSLTMGLIVAFIGTTVGVFVGLLAGFAGGPGVTTYGENIGVMAATRVYSTLIFPVAACFAILLGFSPKFGAVIQSIPGPLLGAVSVVVFGFIAAAGARIWVESKVDLSTTRNLIVVAITLIVGTGDFSLTIAGFNLGGIGTATLAAIGLNLLFALKENY